MEGNKDESERCLRIAEKCIIEGNREKARKFLDKAERLYPSRRAKDLLSRLDASNGSATHGPSDAGASSASTPDVNPDAAASGGDESETTTRQRRTASSMPSEPPPVEEKKYTPEQLEMVRKVLKCKDYYEILGVSKDKCSEDDLKKAYKKLALKLHPDKNHAPKSAEAFKAVGNAFAVLNDPKKKNRYDQYGNEDERHTSRRGYEFDRGFEGDISAEELFNMFFGGGAFPSGSGRVYTHHRMNRHTYHQSFHNHGDRQTEPTYTLILQLAPILFLVFLSLISSFLVSDPVYSLERTERYNFARKTSNLGVAYFVKRDFSTEYKGSMRRLEQHVEDDYISNLRTNCFKERSYKENMLWRARNFNDARLYEKAQNLKTPSCDTLQSIYS